MEYNQYKKLQEQVEGRAKDLAEKAEKKFDHVADEVQAKGQDEYEKVTNLYHTKKPFKYIVIAGVISIVVAVVLGVIFG